MRKFIFRLALALGRTVDELLHSISSAELSEWIAFDRVERLPDPYWIGGMTASVIANSVAGAKTTPADFIPREVEKPRQTQAEMIRNIQIMARHQELIHKK